MELWPREDMIKTVLKNFLAPSFCNKSYFFWYFTIILQKSTYTLTLITHFNSIKLKSLIVEI